ncbi:MAG: sensor histidine kinase [Crocinitomicaceae bacterium]|nr:sensor histidine kinase [Crocinitomicaceae bacterium]
MASKSLETQIQYKLIERLSSTNQELLAEIKKVKLREREIAKILTDKEILLKEVNHRVKNNLQVIHSLLSAQINLSNSDELISHLQEVQSRLHSISILHDMMHNSEGSYNISLASYLREIISYTLGNSSSFTVDCPDITPYFESISSLGMIVHELLTNSLKYAHNPNDTLSVQLTITHINNALKIQYSDNGQNISNVHDIIPGFGMNLIEILLGSKEDSNLKYTLINGSLMTEFEYRINAQ